MMNTPVLEASAVDKQFPNGVTALQGIYLTVARGETMVLIGESGSGKTTLLRLFNRLDDPTAGDIWIHGRSAREEDPILLRRRIGYVQQDGGLLPHWTVGRNVGLVPTLLGWPADQTQHRVETLLELVNLDPHHYWDRYPSQLSGGERQRVAFARALAADPEVVLLDEPFGALDAITRDDLQKQFLQLKGKLHKTMVLVTHDLNEAFRLGDRVAVLRQGRVLQTGTPDQLLKNPAEGYVRSLLDHRAGFKT
ncbi:MAG: ATP-binding cassette domain-containing protein [Nitrospirota bacterium]|nr:ATP-binding cassette domain-containing protein [Nitrospirota bacterium]